MEQNKVEHRRQADTRACVCAVRKIRVVDCYSEPHAFVEVSQTAPWKLLRINVPAQKVTGARCAHAGQGFQMHAVLLTEAFACASACAPRALSAQRSSPRDVRRPWLIAGLEGNPVSGKPFWEVFAGLEESNAVVRTPAAGSLPCCLAPHLLCPCCMLQSQCARGRAEACGCLRVLVAATEAGGGGSSSHQGRRFCAERHARGLFWHCGRDALLPRVQARLPGPLG